MRPPIFISLDSDNDDMDDNNLEELIPQQTGAIFSEDESMGCNKENAIYPV